MFLVWLLLVVSRLKKIMPMKENSTSMKKNTNVKSSNGAEKKTITKSDEKLIDQVYKMEDELLSTARYYTKSLSDAQDLVQEVYVKVMENPDKFDGKNLLGWLKTIMRNTFLNEWKRSKRNVWDSEMDAADKYTSVQPMFSAPALADQHCYESEIRSIFESTNEDQREAFEMYINGYKYKDIAEMTGVSIGTVKSRISLFRKSAMKELKDYGTVSHRRAA